MPFELNDATLTLARLWAIKVACAAGALLVGWVLASWLARRAAGALRRARFEPTLAGFISGAARWAILVFAFVTALGQLGVGTTTFAALLGAGGIALALALQGTLTSFAAGVSLILFRPFRVGDTIKVGLQQGRVDEIDLFTTTIDTTDNRRVILPNNAVFGQTIENHTHHRRRVVELTVPVPNTIDVEDARRALEEAARALPEASADPEPEVQATEVQAAQVIFRLRVWVATDRLASATDGAVRAVRRALDAAPKRAA